MTDPRSSFMQLFSRGATLGEVATRYGLNAEEMGEALNRAKLMKDQRKRIRQRQAQLRPAYKEVRPGVIQTPQGKLWCDQCDRGVLPAEAKACRSQFCKAKEAA